jgi:hypothetical protein
MRRTIRKCTNSRQTPKKRKLKYNKNSRRTLISRKWLQSSNF